MGLKVYISGKWQHEANENSWLVAIKDLVSEMKIKETFDWGGLEDPRSRDAAEQMRTAVLSADVLILDWSKDLLGGLLETGMALGAGKRVIIVGAKRDSSFWNLPEVVSVFSLDSLRDELERETVFAEAPYDDPIRPNDVKMPARLIRVGDEPHMTVMGGDEYFSVVRADRPYRGKVKLTMTSWGGEITDSLDPNRQIEIRGRK